MPRITDPNVLIQLQSTPGHANVLTPSPSVFVADGYPTGLTSTMPHQGRGSRAGTETDMPVDAVIARFGPHQNGKDVVELHIYNPIDELLESIYDAPYDSRRGLNSGENNGVNRVNLNLHSIFRDLGYISGKFKFQLNFHRHILGDEINNCEIVTISPDRTEVVISYPGPGSLEQEPVLDSFGNRLEYYLNAGSNLLYRIGVVALNSSLTTATETVYTLTLADALPGEFIVGNAVWVDLQVADPRVDIISVFPDWDDVEPIHALRGPNFNVDIHAAQSTVYKSWNDLLGSNPTSSQQLINKFVSASFDPIELPIDYRDYSQFVFYGSATERLDNFKFKLQLLEYYQGALSAATNVANPFTNNTYVDISNKINNLLAGFDGYEKYLYYESSSYESGSYGEFFPTTWPKKNSSKPYVLYSVTSSQGNSWFQGQRESASYYDRHNDNSLFRLVPEHVVTDFYNESYITFVNMIGQHFDILWSYVHHLSKISSREESLNHGLAKDLIYHVLRSHGIDSAHGFKLEELWLDALALDASGSYRQSGSLQSIPNSDISKETFKRILNNLPYLLKTKGTKRGIRALLNCYGVPSTIYRVKEFSGPYQYKSNVYNDEALYRQVEKFTLAAYLTGSAQISVAAGATTKMFRFKPASTASVSIGGNTLTYVSGNIGTLNGVPGPFYNGYWITVTSLGKSFQCINGVVFDYPTGTVTSPFGPCDAYIQEIKGFNTTLPIEVLREHARNPQSQIGASTVETYAAANWQNTNAYDYTSAYTQMAFRFPMGTTLQTYSNGSIPSITTNPAITATATISGFTTASYVGNVEDYYVWYPNLADNLDIAGKIRIESSSTISGRLYPDHSVEKSQFDFYSFDSPKLGVYFSPQDEINEDIADQFSGLSMDNLIGDPRYDRANNYPALEAVARHYHLKYTSDNIFWKYLKLVENFDASMFYLVKSFLPARAVKMVGLVIQPTLLERSKSPYIGDVAMESDTFDANFGSISPDDLLGDVENYDAIIADFTHYAITSEDLEYDTTVGIYNPLDISAEYDSYDGTATITHGAISSNVENVMDQLGIRFYPAGTWNHLYGGCRISSRAVNVPSPDTFDGAPVIQIWTNSPNTPVSSTGVAGALQIANSPNVSGGRFNAIFPNGLNPVIPVTSLNGRSGTITLNPTIPSSLGGTTVTNPTALNGRGIVNYMNPLSGQ